MIQLPVEIKGQQLRIRVRSPKGAINFRTKDVGKKGRLQFIMGEYKNGWRIQSYRLNLNDYKNYDDAVGDLDRLYEKIGKVKFNKANMLMKKWFVRG